MANNKYYGYTPKPQKGNVGVPYGENQKFVNQNPYEFRKGMDYELTSLGCSRLAESTPEERQKATESVLKNLGTHPSWYSAKLQYETKYSRNYASGPGEKSISFNKWLSEYVDENKMKPVDQSFKNDKMTEPKYDKKEYTISLKEAIKNKVRQKLSEAKEDKYDMDTESEPTSAAVKNANLKGLQDAVLDTKDALAEAQKTLKELGPDIKKLAKETNEKIKKNPAKKSDYLKVYQSDPDVKEFVKIRKMLKSAGLL